MGVSARYGDENPDGDENPHGDDNPDGDDKPTRCRGSRLPLSLDAGCLPANAGARPADGLPPGPWPSCLLSADSRSAAHATRPHRLAPATTDDRGCYRRPDIVVPIHQGDVGRERRLADKHMVSTQILFYIVGGTFVPQTLG